MRAIKSWPLIEATLTPIPVDPNNRAVAIKALAPTEPPDPGPAAGSLVGRSEALVAEAVEVLALWQSAVKSRESEGRTISEAKRLSLRAVLSAVADLERALRIRPGRGELDDLRRRLALSEVRHGCIGD